MKRCSSHNDRLQRLMNETKETFERLTPDAQLHHRHLQRISFVSGNVALSSTEGIEKIREHVRLEAGPCPCQSCVRLR